MAATNWEAGYSNIHPDSAHRIVCLRTVLAIIDNVREGQSISGLVRLLGHEAYPASKNNDEFQGRVDEIKNKYEPIVEDESLSRRDRSRARDKRDEALFQLFYDRLWSTNVFRGAAVKFDESAKEFLSDDDEEEHEWLK